MNLIIDTTQQSIMKEYDLDTTTTSCTLDITYPNSGSTLNDFQHSHFAKFGNHQYVNGTSKFLLYHSTQKGLYEIKSYSWHGIYPSFEYFNVESRKRVKCISGIEGVPVSNQWNSKGHFYPIQIAQYGLSHFSKSFNNDSKFVNIMDQMLNNKNFEQTYINPKIYYYNIKTGGGNYLD
ncbi:unnamed protein product [Gordionus sp. m RMFG-2023]